MTPMERARRFLDQQSVLPASLPENTPIRIIHELVKNRHDAQPDALQVRRLESKVNEAKLFRDELAKYLRLPGATNVELLDAVARLAK